MCMALCSLNRAYGQRVCVPVVAQAGRANKCLSDHLGRDLLLKPYQTEGHGNRSVCIYVCVCVCLLPSSLLYIYMYLVPMSKVKCSDIELLVGFSRNILWTLIH